MSDREKRGKKKFRFGFKTMLIIYLVLSTIFTWSQWTKYKQKIAERHNAKAKELFGRGTTDEHLIMLKDFSYITILNLESTNISSARLIHLKPLANLTKLWLYNTRISDAGLMYLKSLTNLTTLGSAGTEISDAGLVHLKSLTNLTKLNLSQTEVTKTGIAELKRALPNCEIYSNFD